MINILTLFLGTGQDYSDFQNNKVHCEFNVPYSMVKTTEFICFNKNNKIVPLKQLQNL